jgi:hypothetical protein
MIKPSEAGPSRRVRVRTTSRAAAAELTKRAIPTPRGGDWQSTTVMRLLRSCVVAIDRGSIAGRQQFSAGPGTEFVSGAKRMSSGVAYTVV